MSELCAPFAVPALTRAGRKLRVTLPLEAWEVITLVWRRDPELPAADELRETLTFDMRSGRAYLRLEGPEGAVYDVCDLSGRCPAGDPLLDSFGRFPALREALAEAIGRVWGAPLPFQPAELTAERCAALCAYRGYGRDFYDAVPLRFGGAGVPREFRRAARTLRRAEDLPAAVAASGLPQVKSVRRALFARPALLFYGAQLRSVYAAMPDLNCFCALLAEPYVFSLLSALRSFPGMADYYRDLGRTVGGPTLLRLLRESRCNLGMSAMAYAAMDPRGRRRERQSWAGTFRRLSARCIPFFTDDELDYSVPVPGERTCAVPALSAAGGYSFERLRTSRDFACAGAALHNCLAEMPCYLSGETVVAVRLEGAVVAAVHLRRQRVIQALAERNRPIEPNTALGRAYRAWAARYGLEAAEEEA